MILSIPTESEAHEEMVILMDLVDHGVTVVAHHHEVDLVSEVAGLHILSICVECPSRQQSVILQIS